MSNALKLRMLQGDPVVADVRNASFPERYRGLPEIKSAICPSNCTKCLEACPSDAIQINPLKIDLGLCTFCPACSEACPEEIIRFTGNYHLGASGREELIIDKNKKSVEIEKASQKIISYFGRSLKLRQISAAGCNGCELELNALSNVNFDMGRYGVEFVASPRHADGIVISGPVSKNMANATQICYDAVPDPKIIILFGICAISGGVFRDSEQIQRDFLKEHKIDLFIPGCPPHPLTFINALLDWLDKK